MTTTFKTLDELMAEDEAAIIERTRREIEDDNLPANVAKREAKRKEEFERGIRLGWWDADGTPIAQDTDDETDDENDDEDDDNV